MCAFLGVGREHREKNEEQDLVSFLLSFLFFSQSLILSFFYAWPRMALVGGGEMVYFLFF